jgi:Na+-transporting NADH:ubiquinone oxidoreductase subunit D
MLSFFDGIGNGLGYSAFLVALGVIWLFGAGRRWSYSHSGE